MYPGEHVPQFSGDDVCVAMLWSGSGLRKKLISQVRLEKSDCQLARSAFLRTDWKIRRWLAEVEVLVSKSRRVGESWTQRVGHELARYQLGLAAR